MQEMIEESGGGLLFKTEQELEDAVSRLTEDPSYRDDLGEQGHQAYLRNWAQDVHLKRYFDLIEHLSTVRGPWAG